MNARSYSLFLYIIGKLKPGALDAIIPHGPKVSVASREYLIAMTLKGFSSELGDRGIQKKLAGVQRKLVQFASEHLAEAYDDDDWCPTRPRPVPHPGPGPFPLSPLSYVALNPQPLPPGELKKEIGGDLLMLSEATSLEAVAGELEGIGNSLVGR